MKDECRRIRDIVAGEGPQGLGNDPSAESHLAECSGCFDFLEAHAELDPLLANLPAADAPDEVVERLLERVAAESSGSRIPGKDRSWAPRAVKAFTVKGKRLWRRALAGLRAALGSPVSPGRRWAMAAALTLTGLFALFVVVTPRLRTTRGNFDVLASPEVTPRSVGQATGEKALREEELGVVAAYGNAAGPLSSSPPPSPPEPVRQLPKEAGADKLWVGVEGEPTFRDSAGNAEMPPQLDRLSRIPRRAGAEIPRPKVKEKKEDASAVGHLSKSSSQGLEAKAKGNGISVGGTLSGLDLETELQAIAPGIQTPGKAGALAQAESQAVRKLARRRNLRLERGLGANEEGSEAGRRQAGAFFSESDDEFAPGDRKDAGKTPAPDPDGRSSSITRDFLSQKAQVAGVLTQQAEGYWSNAYVPGDPAFRLLQSRILSQGRGELERHRGSSLRLHEGSHRTAQPFDPPRKAAMAIYLQADRRGIVEPGRAMVQVGLQATDRRSGRRPSLNLALVLDLSGEVPAEAASALRALVLEMGKRWELGDRFHLIVAGRPGGLVVEPEAFRHGRLVVTLNQLFGLGGSSAQTLNLGQAFETAIESVAQGDDPNSPLGSSAVLIATARSLGPETSTLAALAHESAVAGIPISVIGVGGGVDRVELDRLALAGQGNRRLLAAPAEAPALVDRVLSSVSRAVARALRLRVRLAPGVELVEVLGSQPLDASRAEEVREAERSIDQRLARNLGIEVDRGEDEEGIQIVIPTFYSGDAHVVLLDVVVPGPGPVADVTLRYKDLVHLRNGVARSHLNLKRGDPSMGPLEINVLKNELAFRLFETLEEAGRLVAAGSPEQARQQLEGFAQLLQGLRREIPALAKDPDIERDLAMVAEYLSVLGGEEPPPRLQNQLADSLRYAARLKILPQPAGGVD